MLRMTIRPVTAGWVYTNRLCMLLRMHCSVACCAGYDLRQGHCIHMCDPPWAMRHGT